MKKLTIFILFFTVTSCVSIPKSTQNDILEIKKGLASLGVKVDTNTINIQKNYQSFIKILQNATNPNSNYKPLSDDELLKLLGSPTTNGKGSKN